MIFRQLPACEHASEKIRYARGNICRDDHVEVRIAMRRDAEGLSAAAFADFDSLDLQGTTDGFNGQRAIVGVVDVQLHPELLLVDLHVSELDSLRRDRWRLQMGIRATAEKEHHSCSLAQSPGRRH